MKRIQAAEQISAWEPVTIMAVLFVFGLLAWLYGESCRHEGYEAGAAYERHCHAEKR